MLCAAHTDRIIIYISPKRTALVFGKTPPPAQGVQPQTPQITNMPRRGFVGAAGTFVIGVNVLSACSPKAETPAKVAVLDDGITPSMASAATADSGPLLFIGIAPDNQVSLTVHRSEMGQQT